MSEWGCLKHKLLDKNESRVRRADLKEKACFFNVFSKTATHLVCLVPEVSVLFFTLTLSKYSTLSLALSHSFLLQGTEKDFCGREDATMGNS